MFSGHSELSRCTRSQLARMEHGVNDIRSGILEMQVDRNGRFHVPQDNCGGLRCVR